MNLCGNMLINKFLEVAVMQCSDKYEVLKEYINQNKNESGILINCLHKAQELFGCLNEEVQTFVADSLNLPLIEVYGVSTFYSEFDLEKKGKYDIGVCMGTTCYLQNARGIVKEIENTLGIKVGETTKDGLFTMEAPRCIGACGLAPLVSINDTVYAKVEPGAIKDILKQYS